MSGSSSSVLKAVLVVYEGPVSEPDGVTALTQKWYACPGVRSSKVCDSEVVLFSIVFFG